MTRLKHRTTLDDCNEHWRSQAEATIDARDRCIAELLALDDTNGRAEAIVVKYRKEWG